MGALVREGHPLFIGGDEEEEEEGGAKSMQGGREVEESICIEGRGGLVK